MKRFVAAFALLTISSTAFSQTILTCRGSISGGSLFKSVELVKDMKEFSINSVDYSNQKSGTKVKAIETSPVSTKYMIASTDEDKVSLVVSNGSKQAVILIEALVEGVNKTTIEFLKCK